MLRMRQVRSVNTIEPMVVPSPLGWEPLAPQPRRRWLMVAVPAVIMFALLAASFRVVLPYYAIAPGSARQVNDLIQVPDTARHPPRGRVLLTTVSLGQVRAIDALAGWLDPNVDLVPRDKILPPDTSGRQYRQLNVQLMDESKQTAIVVALRRLGYEVRESGEGALVVRVFRGLPADDRLEPGDVITAVDDRPTPLFQDAVAAIRARRPGDVVRLSVMPGTGAPPRVEELVLAASPDGKGAAVVGVELRTNKLRFDMPFPVDIRSGTIGGPSAGLAFTLGVIDALTAGELTGGRKVAVTGTMNMDGSVGDVGGVAQKTVAVRRSGAEVFLVPAGEFAVARAKAGPDLTVLKVSNLQEALEALGSVGGEVSALSPPPAPRG